MGIYSANAVSLYAITPKHIHTSVKLGPADSESSHSVKTWYLWSTSSHNAISSSGTLKFLVVSTATRTQRCMILGAVHGGNNAWSVNREKIITSSILEWVSIPRTLTQITWLKFHCELSWVLLTSLICTRCTFPVSSVEFKGESGVFIILIQCYHRSFVPSEMSRFLNT